MKSRTGIGVRQTQRLQLTTSLAASIQILRTDAAGLTRYLEEQAAENAALRLSAPPPPVEWLPRWSTVLGTGSGSGNAIEEIAANSAPSLIAHVTGALESLSLGPRERRIALALAEALEPSGWIGRPLAAVADETQASVAEVEAVLAKVQEIEPAGLFARNLAECLLLQARDSGVLDTILERMLTHLDVLASADWPRLARLCRAGVAEVQARFRVIRSFNPKPGTQFAAHAAPVREPDLTAVKGADGWQVALNRSALPSLSLAENRATGDRAAARDLIRQIENRNATLLRVGQAILLRQSAALERGLGALVPMTMAEIAADLDLHESTISRVVAGASVDTPRGTWWLRSLFSKAMGGDASGAALRERLSRLIAAEDGARPLSDEALAAALSQDGAVVARRTVAKYRAALGIPPAHGRRIRRTRLPAAASDRSGRRQG